MAKTTTIYVCENCGNESLQWSGRCSQCGEWNSLRELRGIKTTGRDARESHREPRPAANIIGIEDVKQKSEFRLKSGIGEFDRTLGGGIVAGSVILIGGQPGIGKSTLLMQLAGQLKNVLYISGEESVNQIKIRAERLAVTANVGLLIETEVGQICEAIVTTKPSLVIIDSIQTLYDPEFPSTPGSIVQVRECALRVQQTAKASEIPTILVGHVTKEGGVAGPKTLEHLVDVVLYLEGEPHQGARILRTVKNRFGATDEIGLFEMRQEGLIEIDNPSEFLLGQRQTATAGSAIGVVLEGTRPLLIEVQALTHPSSFGYAKRTASGFDLNRLNVLIAVLLKRAYIDLSNQDIYVNIVGGLQLKEPALDLAIAMSLVSAAKNIPLPSHLAFFGEIGLSGEIRSVIQAKTRELEAQRLGYSVVTKRMNLKQVIDQVFPKG